jgi:hypothetical protein
MRLDWGRLILNKPLSYYAQFGGVQGADRNAPNQLSASGPTVPMLGMQSHTKSLPSAIITRISIGWLFLSWQEFSEIIAL